MARCWTCGATVSTWQYKCSACRSFEQVEALRSEIESAAESIVDGLSTLTAVTQRGFTVLASEISNLSSIVQWGFEELSWELQQQTEALTSIDRTLKTLTQTQANEWRKIAEELRIRGVLDECKNFLLKSMEANPLDYRTLRWTPSLGQDRGYIKSGYCYPQGVWC